MLACALMVGSASASTWTVAKLDDGPVKASFYGISCPTTSLCVAVGGNGTVAASANPTGGAAAWNVGHSLGSVDDLPFGGGTYGGGQIRGVSCLPSGFCAAASFEGSVYSSANPLGGASTWKAVPLGEEKEPRVHMGGISCPSPSLCVAVAYGGKVVSSTNPSGGREDWSTTQLAQPYDLRGVACPTVSLCVAVGNEGSILTSTNPTGGPAAWNWAGAPGGDYSLNGVSCPSPSLCVTGNAGQLIVSTNPTGGAGSWSVVSAGSGLPVKGVSCPSISACAAIDNNADVIASTAPTGGQGAWWFKNVLAYGAEVPGEGNGMFGISCPTESLCVAAGQDHQVISSTDPFVPDAAKIPARGNAKRPRAVITKHPAKRLDHRKGGVKVTFRFRAIGNATGFKCKIDKRRFRTCKSPRRYRAGGGKHVFKVRAVAPGGASGPAAAFHFRVGGLTERAPYGSCPSRPAGMPAGQPCVNAR